MTSMITSSSSSKFITSIPIDFNFSIKYSSDLFDPLTSFKSLIRSLWLQTTFRTGFDLNPRTEKPNLCPKRVSSSPSRKHRVQVFYSWPYELQTKGPTSTVKVYPVSMADRVLPFFSPISISSALLPFQLGPMFFTSNLIEKTFPTSIFSFLLVYRTITWYFLSIPTSDPFLSGTLSSLSSQRMVSALNSGRKWLKQSSLRRLTYLWVSSSCPAPLQMGQTSSIDMELRVPLPSQLQQRQKSAGRAGLRFS